MKLSNTQNEVLFITDASGNKTHAILPIETYQSLMALKDMISSSAPISEQELYTLTIKELSATGYPTGDRHKPAFVVIKQSQAVLNTAASLPEHIRNFRENLLDQGKLVLDAAHNCFCFAEDLLTPSSSFAAALVSGNIRDGLTVWKNREGFSLKESGYGIKKKHKR